MIEEINNGEIDMVLKGLIGGALLSIAIPVFAVGMATGVLLARKPKRHPECKKCCMICNGSCNASARDDGDLSGFGYNRPKSDYSI